MRDEHPGKISAQISRFLAIAMLLLACLIIPKYNAEYFSGNVRCIALFLIALLFGFSQFFNKTNTVKFHTTDMAWLGLITFTAASIIWSDNEIYALYGLVSTTLLYLCYKAFENIEWTGKVSRYLLAALLVCIVFNLGVEVQVLRRYLFPFIYDRGGLEMQVLRTLNVNLNFLGSSLLVLLPFFLFRESKKNIFIDVVVIAMVLYVIAFSGSAQVMLGAMFLTLFYVLYKLKISGKKLLYLLLRLSFLIFGGLLLTYLLRGSLLGISFVTDEFFAQSDRFWMWENSWKMFTNSPLMGQGKNSWELMSGAFGMDGCRYCQKELYSIRNFKHAHNSIFQIIGEMGLPGLLFYAGIGVLPFVQLCRKKASLPPLVLSAVVSLLLFFFFSMTYGVIYNTFNSFSGLTVLAAFSLALCSQFAMEDKAPKFALSKRKFYFVYTLLAAAGLFFFIQFNNAESNFKKGDILFKNKKYEAARTAYLNALPYHDNFQVYKQLAIIHQRTGDPQNALYYFEAAMEKNPYALKEIFQYGNILFNQGDHQKAQTIALYVYDMAPWFIPNKVLLAKCYFKNGETAKGIEFRDALLRRLKRYLPRENSVNRGRKLPAVILKRNELLRRDIGVLEKIIQ